MKYIKDVKKIIALFLLYVLLFSLICVGFYFCVFDDILLLDYVSLCLKFFVSLTGFIGLIVAVVNMQLATRALRNAALLNANIKLCEYEYKIANNVNLLRFHIDEEPSSWLKKYGLSEEEFAYLLASFSCSSALYSTSPEGRRLVEIGSYRDNMFKTKAMQIAWPAIREMLANKEFVEKMDALYDLHKR